jgi:hypothetical protein
VILSKIQADDAFANLPLFFAYFLLLRFKAPKAQLFCRATDWQHGKSRVYRMPKTRPKRQRWLIARFNSVPLADANQADKHN